MIEVVDGVFHFPKALIDLEETDLRAIADAHKHEFYVPKIKSGHYMNLQMASFGKHWNAIDYKYYDTRNDIDDKPVNPVPGRLANMARQFSLEAFPYHNPSWDICLMNRYEPGSTLGMHQDNSESVGALEIGHPVVSFSIGSSCIFRIGGKVRAGIYHDIQLGSGDVVVFGGKARLNYHGIVKVNGPEPRINFTLRKM